MRDPRTARGVALATALLAAACTSKTVSLNGYDAGTSATLVDGAVVSTNSVSLYDAAGSGVCPGEDAGTGVVTLFSDPNTTCSGFGALAIDDTNVYWVDKTSTTTKVLSVPKCGGSVATVTTTGSAPIAVDFERVYWVDGNNVRSASKQGGATTAASLHGYGAGTFVVEDGMVYVLSAYEVVRLVDGGGVVENRPPDYTQETIQLVSDGAYLYWTALANSDASYSLSRVPLGGGDATTLWSEPRVLEGAYGLATDDDSVYLRDSSAQIWKIPKAGGSSFVVAGTAFDAGSNPQVSRYPGLVVDATSLYWTVGLNPPLYDDFYGDEFGGSILQIPKGGGTPVTVATGSTFQLSAGVAVDGTSAYWLGGVSYGSAGIAGCQVQKVRHGS